MTDVNLHDIQAKVEEFRFIHNLNAKDIEAQSLVVAEEFGEMMETVNEAPKDYDALPEMHRLNVLEESCDLIYTILLLNQMAGNTTHDILDCLNRICDENNEKNTERNGGKITKE